MNVVIAILMIFHGYVKASTPSTDIDKFISIYKNLEIKEFQLSHEKNIESLLGLLSNSNLENKINKLQKLSHSCAASISCTLIKHEVKRFEQRFSFSKKLKSKNVKNFKELKEVMPLYKESYKLALSEWTNDFDLSIEDISRFEMNEIERIRKELSNIKPSKNTKSSSAQEVIKYLKDINEKVKINLGKLFTIQTVAEIKIELNTNPQSQNIPGYYDSSKGTFYFSMPNGEDG